MMEHPKFKRNAFDPVAVTNIGDISIDNSGYLYEYQQITGFDGNLYFKWQLLGNIKNLFNKEPK